MEKGSHFIEKRRKLFSSKGIFIGTFFGGPLATGILLAINFKTLKQGNKIFIAVCSGIVLAIAIPYLKIAIKNNYGDLFILKLWPLIFSGVVYYFLKKYQTQVFHNNFETEEKYSNWKAFFVGIVCLLIIALCAFLYTLVIFNEQK